MENHEFELFGTTTFGIIVRDMVILAADGRVSRLDGTVLTDNAVNLEWVTDSVFVTKAGSHFHSAKIIQNVRNMCKDSPPSTIEAIVDLFVQESNKQLSTILKDPRFDATIHRWTITVGGKLHVEKHCKLFRVTKYKGQQSYVSDSKGWFTNNSRGEGFFTQDVRHKLIKAHNHYDRALLSEIVKAYIADSCANDPTSGGRVTMVTIDARGFHLFESADLIDPEDPSKGYKESEFDEFYPVGYRTG